MTDHSILRMVNAILMTGLAVILILGLDKIADWMRPIQDRKSTYIDRLRVRPPRANWANNKPPLYRSGQSVFGLEEDMPLKDRVQELQSQAKDSLDEVHQTMLSLSNLEG